MKRNQSIKVIIANSVGVDRWGNHIVHFPSRWTASVGKEKPFTYYPYELAYLSSLLKRETDYQIKLIDGNFLQLNAEQYTELLAKEEPDWLVMETASMVFEEDLRVARALKDESGTRIIFAGQHPTAFPAQVLAQGIDFVCLGEYEFTVLELLQGKDPAKIMGLHPNPRRPLLDPKQLPWPEDEDISRADYLNIYGSDYKEIEIFGSRGCPKSCTFCVASTLYYQRANWRPRNVTDIVAEMKYLRDRYPQIEGFFFDEEEHNVKKDFVIALSKEIIKQNMDDLHISAMCGYSTLDRDVMEMMKDAGYYKLRVGIETASEVVAKAMNKRVDIPRLISVLEHAKDIGLKMYGTFTIGAPLSTAEEDLKTIKLIKQLVGSGLLDDCQISITTPQPGTPFYRWAEEKGFLRSKNWRDYDGLTCTVVNYPNYSKEEIKETFQMAVNSYQNTLLWREIKRKRFLQFIKGRVEREGFLPTFKKGIRKLLY